jgi:decaprenylphospho-beta-D-ribofuranose 2-oxidase
LGLTGIILNATLQLTQIQSDKIQVTSQRFHSFTDLFEKMKFTAAEFDYSVAWLDLISTGSREGRGIFETGSHDTMETADKIDSLYKIRTIGNIPTWFPGRILNKTTGKAYNALRYFLALEGKANRSVPISDFMHPLDRVDNWNRLYGPTGFIQWQIAIPEQSESILVDLVKSISGSEIPAFLGVLKKFGPANNAPLSFPIQGWTLAVDFPAKHHSLKKFLDILDREILNAGGRVYLVKDARMDSSLVPKMYPRLEEWSTIRDRVDPNRRWQSDFSRRLNL